MISAEPGSWPRTHRVTVDEYRRMGEAGVFLEGQRVELIEGEIVDMPPMGSRHAVVVTVLADRLSTAASEVSAHVRIQLPLRLGADSEPQPDVAVVRGHPRQYWSEHPGPRDVLLAVEVAESTLRFDLDVKARVYAAHGIPEYWVVDVAGEKAFVFRQPEENGYASRETIVGGTVTCMSMRCRSTSAACS